MDVKQAPSVADLTPDSAIPDPAVLIVDDRPENLLALRAVLDPLASELGFVIAEASSSDDALRHVLLIGEALALVLLDVQMPVTDGLETARMIRKRVQSEHVPIIFVTGVEMNRRGVTIGYQSGAVDYMMKPLDPDVLRGKVRSFVTLHRRRLESDVRERRRFADQAAAAEQIAMEAIRASDARIRTVLDALPDAVSIFDREWRWTYVNPAGKEVLARLGADPERLIGRVLWEVIPSVPGSAFEEQTRRAASERRELVYEAYIPSLDAWYEERAVPGPDGSLTTYARNVTDRRRAEMQREQAHAEAEIARAGAEAAREAAEQADRAKGTFLATMSHEFRTPLNAQIGYLQLLEMEVGGPVTEAQRQYIRRLRASSEHLLGLVNDVLDLAKVEAGQLTVVNEVALADRATEAAIALLQPQAEAKGVTLTDADGASEVAYVGDEHRVRQILLNLLSNAVKFTPAGGKVQVERARSSEGPAGHERDGNGTSWAIVRVRDTGIGISTKDLDTVFAPFHQVDGGHTRSEGGTGLGLAISRRLARLMGGDLLVESELGVGSTFSLWLPGAEA